MSLSSIQLDAFAQVAMTKNFSLAARNLHITQSALSQRILNLESELGTAVFIRGPSGIRLTETGQKLLHCYRARFSLEDEFLSQLKDGRARVGGVLRIAGFSTVVRSVVMPVINALVCESPSLHLELSTAELNELPGLLINSEVDFILHTQDLKKAGINSVIVGYEENVLVEPIRIIPPAGLYLDHDAADTLTEEFFRVQRTKPQKYRRRFLGEIYGIIEGVSLGWGRAVVPRHLVAGNAKIKLAKGFVPLRVPVYLSYFEQPYYSRLHEHVLKTLQDNLSKRLSG